MSKRIVFAVAVAASLAVTPAFAGAELHATSHTVRLSGVIDTLSSTGAIGIAGTRETDSGILHGTVSGRSVGQAAFYQTSTWGPGLTLVGSGRVFNTLGSLRFKATATFTVSPNATESYVGTLTVTGGTGRYTGVHGTVKVAGNAPANGDTDAAAVNITGKMTY